MYAVWLSGLVVISCCKNTISHKVEPLREGIFVQA